MIREEKSALKTPVTWACEQHRERKHWRSFSTCHEPLHSAAVPWERLAPPPRAPVAWAAMTATGRRSGRALQANLPRRSMPNQPVRVRGKHVSLDARMLACLPCASPVGKYTTGAVVACGRPHMLCIAETEKLLHLMHFLSTHPHLSVGLLGRRWGASVRAGRSKRARRLSSSAVFADIIPHAQHSWHVCARQIRCLVAGARRLGGLVRAAVATVACRVEAIGLPHPCCKLAER